MPKRNGTGPLGFGPMTGRGLGFCNMANVSRLGLGLGFGLGLRLGRGRGFGRRMACYFAGYPGGYPVQYPAANPIDLKTQKELLEQQKAFLEDRLNVISKQLDGLSDND
ncbi:MAG TPA: DUF5320 domain-containing protein [Clostridia bacterium]|nr:DUF5320 domain-containing protein [Clostridia bacterium]